MGKFVLKFKANKATGIFYTILVKLRQQVLWEGPSACAMRSRHGSENWEVK